MGFLIIIGPLRNKGEDGFGVRINADWGNTISLSYAMADLLFKNGAKKLWRLMRAGDVNGADPVIVSLTNKIVELIGDLDNETYQDLKDVLQVAKRIPGEPLFIETR